jgi:hypothetical protein
VGAAALGALFPQALGIEMTNRKPLIGKYFHDANLDFGRRFADELARNRVDSSGVLDNWTNVWSREIDPIWRKQPMAIAGVTQHGPMFMLTQLAQRHGMRLVYQAEIIQRGRDCGIRVQGLNSMSDSCGLVGADAARLPEDLAVSFLSVSGVNVPRSMRFAASSGQTAGSEEDPVYAWIIAPVAGAAQYI